MGIRSTIGKVADKVNSVASQAVGDVKFLTKSKKSWNNEMLDIQQNQYGKMRSVGWQHGRQDYEGYNKKMLRSFALKEKE